MIVTAFLTALLALIGALIGLIPPWTPPVTATSGIVTEIVQINNVFPLTALVSAFAMVVGAQLAISGFNFAVWVWHQFHGAD